MNATQRLIAVSADLAPSFLDALARKFTIAARWKSGTETVSWLDGHRAAEALVVPSIVAVPGGLLGSLADLKLICCFGAGYDGVPLDEAVRRNILVTHSPGANAGAVAEMAMALLLAVTRDVVRQDAFVRSGAWATSSPGFAAQGLQGCKAGIVGMGAVGAAVVARLAPFGVEIGYSSPAPRNSGFPYFEDVVSLANWSDCLVVCARADASTRGLIDARVLQALGPSGVLVNVARGSVIDEKALIAALESRQLAGAGLDVFESEPQISPHLRNFPNVVLSPHVAGRTHAAYVAMAARVTANLEAYFSGAKLPDIIPPMKSLPLAQ